MRRQAGEGLLLGKRLATPRHFLAAHAEDIYIRPQDVRAFAPWLPINGGNRTVLLLGARGGVASGNASSNGTSTYGGDSPLGPPVTLDFGGVVNVFYHPVRGRAPCDRRKECACPRSLRLPRQQLRHEERQGMHLASPAKHPSSTRRHSGRTPLPFFAGAS